MERGDIVLSGVSKIITLLQKMVKLCHIRYGRGEKVKLEKMAILGFALCMSLDTIEILDCIKIHILLCKHSVGWLEVLKQML